MGLSLSPKCTAAAFYKNWYKKSMYHKNVSVLLVNFKLKIHVHKGAEI